MTPAGLDSLSGRPIGWAILLILFGVVTVVVALVSPAGVAVILAWLIQVMGAFLFLHAIESQSEGHVLWKVLVAILYIVFGFYLLKHPLPNIAALTLVLAIFFTVEGVADLATYFPARKAAGAIWMLFDGIITLILGFLVWRQWPSSSLRIIGTLVGLSMIATGTTRLMLSLAARRVAASTA
ncbi:MAG: DUF308 domain-containing protein [Candidatus Korobacteraceae bacterium]